MDLESLQKLNEARLREEILIPLFRAMRFKDARLWHGGIMEQGKDIVMWKEGELGERENYAVVVLAERVSGKATGQNSAGKVATQIQQAFATRIRDEVTATEFGVDRVWVVTSHEITKEAQESVSNVISQSRLHLLTRYISGDKLAALITSHLPISGAVLHLEQAADVLQHSDPNVAIGVTLSMGKKFFWFEGEGGNGGKDITVKYKFDGSPEAQALEAQLEKQSVTGESVTIPTKYISEIDGSDLVKNFLLSIPAITFKGERTAELLRLRMEVLAADDCVYSCNLQMRLRKRTNEEAIFDNEDEPVPWKVALHFNQNGHIHCQFRLWLKSLNAYQKLEQLRCQAALSKSTGINFIDLTTGFNLTGDTSIQMSGVKAPDPRWLALMEKLALIQHKTRQVISTDFTTASPDDLRETEFAYRIVSIGSLTADGPLGLKIDQTFATNVLKAHETKEHFSFTQAYGPEEITLFGQTLKLGFSVLYGEKIVPTEECVRELREKLAAGDLETLEARFTAKEGAEIQRIFPQWRPRNLGLPDAAEKAIDALKRSLQNGGHASDS